MSDWFRISDYLSSRGLLLAVDTLLVAYLIYRLLLLAKGTRAYQVLIGLLVFTMALYLSDVLGLETIHWILDRATALGPVALVILFFPELRRLLETLGRVEFWRTSFGTSYEESIRNAIEEVVTAVEQMARQRIGALIVWERQDTIAQGAGIELQAEVSAPLLLTIFHPGSPLHDGATILRGDQIVESAVYFAEISQNPDIPPYMHTRHRAGIGATESSDCIAIIVSEETGGITVAVDGTWTPNVDANHLRRLLHDLLLGEARQRFVDRVSSALVRRRTRRAMKPAPTEPQEEKMAEAEPSEQRSQEPQAVSQEK